MCRRRPCNEGVARPFHDNERVDAREQKKKFPGDAISRVADHLADLTGFRDREVLDVSLVGALKDLLRPQAVAIYRLVGEEHEQRWLTRARLMRCANPLDAAHAFERLRSNVERYAFLQVGRITVSIGFTELRANDTPNAAFARADKAVYHVKQNGRNHVAHHADLMAAGKLADEARDNSDVELF